MRPKKRFSHERRIRWLGPVLLLSLVLLSPAGKAFTQEAPEEERLLRLDSIETSGNTRTSLETILLYLPIRPGERVDQAGLVDAVDSLRNSGLFSEVDFYTRPGKERGRITLVLHVKEKGPEFRLGTGYHDLSGWYLIPAEIALDNRLGRGERFHLHAKIGYRLFSAALQFEEPRFGDGKSYWGWSLYAQSINRLYFFEEAEYQHKIESAAAEVHIGRNLTRHWSAEIGVRTEKVDADSSAEAHAEDEARGIERGDELPWEELPAEIATAVGAESRSVFHMQLRWDSRSVRRIAGSPASGIWGRARVNGFARGSKNSFAGMDVDVRGYRALGSVALALRLCGGGIGRKALFYDRHYLGGMYAVRGFPNQSLTAPQGDTYYWNGSFELRAPLVGNRERPRLAGLLFLDAGDSWTRSTPSIRDVALSAGYGFRLRVPWISWFGLDFGIPLSRSPVGEAFHAHASIGWTY